jgi:diadenosine tetraphosphate (Ap4A) HIT family hydrolase
VTERHAFDVDALVRRSTSGPCFVCEFLRGTPDYEHVTVAETPDAIAFLSKYPTLFGYVIVAPKRHVEQVTGDFREADYLELQRFIYRVAEAVRRVLSPERVYVLSLGSQAANAHVHWHVAPLPYGVPLDKQQYHALMHENGVVDCTEAELRAYATNLGHAIEARAK